MPFALVIALMVVVYETPDQDLNDRLICIIYFCYKENKILSD